MGQAFVTSVNEVRKAPEYISVFIDENMKRGVKGVSKPDFSSHI